ncbi:MAG: lysoplasmalogenase [Promethearchaeota archaeon]
MMFIHAILLCLLGGFLLVNLVSIVKNSKMLRYVSKPLLVPTIITIHLAYNPSISWLLVIGLIFGFLGDVFLLDKDDNRNFILGLASFLVGHIVYIILFAITSDYSLLTPAFLLFIIPYLIIAIFLSKILKIVPAKMKGPVMVYMVVISLMSFLALMRMPSASTASFWWVFAGSISFMVSDSVLAIAVFADKDARWHVVVMSTYVFAQLFITIGFTTPLN